MPMDPTRMAAVQRLIQALPATGGAGAGVGAEQLQAGRELYPDMQRYQQAAAVRRLLEGLTTQGGYAGDPSTMRGNVEGASALARRFMQPERATDLYDHLARLSKMWEAQPTPTPTPTPQMQSQPGLYVQTPQDVIMTLLRGQAPSLTSYEERPGFKPYFR